MVSNKQFIDSDGVKWGSKEEYSCNQWLIDAGYEGQYVTQYKFIPDRKFKCDFAFVDKKVIIEIMGIDIRGIAGHNNYIQIAKDYLRHMIALSYGWKIIYWCKGVTKADLLLYLDKILSES